ncbi:T6SS effector amidase Tae4 family protein [Massilia sp. W12]|uniref:T6SS effector amidase Tae4 family protein n=1 Tax=Massilia sp. W12 TaxID=3126507 RepID=UPI0030CA7980
MPIACSFSDLWKNYPSDEDYPFETLYKELGWDDLIHKPEWRNTCAVRVHISLLRSGVHVPGRVKVKKDGLGIKNLLIEPGQKALSLKLKSEKFLGEPVKINAKNKDGILKDKKGIISFFKIPGYMVDGQPGGHIDLIKYGEFLYFWSVLECRLDCYWDAEEIWFWPMR